MLKVLSLMKRKEDMSFDEFRKWAKDEHPKLAQKIPGMKGYRMNVPLRASPDLPYDAISEMWWDSDEARLGTDEGKAAGVDANFLLFLEYTDALKYVAEHGQGKVVFMDNSAAAATKVVQGILGMDAELLAGRGPGAAPGS